MGVCCMKYGALDIGHLKTSPLHRLLVNQLDIYSYVHVCMSAAASMRISMTSHICCYNKSTISSYDIKVLYI